MERKFEGRSSMIFFLYFVVCGRIFSIATQQISEPKHNRTSIRIWRKKTSKILTSQQHLKTYQSFAYIDTQTFNHSIMGPLSIFSTALHSSLTSNVLTFLHSINVLRRIFCYFFSRLLFFTPCWLMNTHGTREKDAGSGLEKNIRCSRREKEKTKEEIILKKMSRQSSPEHNGK